MPELTAEQQLAESARQAAVSYRWKTKNLHRFNPTNASAALLGKYIQTHQLPWSEESLDAAFAALVQEGSLEESENEDEVLPQPTPPPAPTLPPWGFVLDRKAVRDLSAAELKKHLQSKQYGKEFAEALNALRITRGELR